MRTAAVLPFLMLGLSFGEPVAQETEASKATQDTQASIDKSLEARRDQLIALRHDLHRHPEVSGQEERTARVIAGRLKKLGLKVQTGVGGHGVVALLEGGMPGPVVAYRADMDAVASAAPDPAPFASENPGVRHICGHDMHVATGIAIAEALAPMRADLRGTVKFIFQPAEENATGARLMVEDGVLQDPAPEAIFGLHTAPMNVGQIASREGLVLPGMAMLSITLKGADNYDAAAMKVAEAIGRVSTISPTGAIDPDTVLTEGSKAAADPNEFIVAGVFESAAGEVDGEWQLLAVVRTSSDKTFARARKAVDRELAALDLGDVSHEHAFTTTRIPSTINNPELVRASLPALRSIVGEEGVLILDAPTPFFSEDFAVFQQEIPGALFFLGVSNPEKGILGMPHSPGYAADDEAIFVGARAMSAVLVDYLDSHPGQARSEPTMAAKEASR